MQRENTGRYIRAFLHTLVDDHYTIETVKLADISTTEDYNRVEALLAEPKLGFAYVSDDKITFVTFDDYPGWMQFAAALGITIKPSSKIAKRVTVMTRTAYLYTTRPAGALAMAMVNDTEFSVEDTTGMSPEVTQRFLDGANVISRELLEEMITNGSDNISNQWDKGRINRAIDRAGSFSLRVTTPDGLIKGDALCSPREDMGGYDLLYHRANLKPEFRTRHIFVLAEAHAPAGPVWTDDQSMSWLGDWLFPVTNLVDAMCDLGDTTCNQLEAGIFPEFFTDTSKLGEDNTITQFQNQALRWHAEGLGVSQSIFLMSRIGQGFINLLTSKRRFPVPCAIYSHVATDSWLAMAGYDHYTTPGTVWFHEPTQRLVYNDLDFAALYDRHGGWDADDSVRAMFRTMDGERVVVVLRSPNSYGEYDIKRYVEGTYYPTWQRADGTELEFPEIGSVRPPYLEELDITYSGLPKPAPSVHQSYTKDFVRDALQVAMNGQFVFGRRANADMVYFYTTGSYRSHQLASIEAIIDACTQEQSDDALMAIDADTEDILSEIVASGLPVDRTLWQRRIGRFRRGVTYDEMGWTQLCQTHDMICEVYAHRLDEIAQACVDNIDADVVDLGKLYAAQGKRLNDWYYGLATTTQGDRNREFYLTINDIMMDKVHQLPELSQINLVLGLAHHCYTVRHGVRWSDTPLFQSGRSGHDSMFELYLRAIAFYGIGQKPWAKSVACSSCGDTETLTDRVTYQMHLQRHARCNNCR